MRQVVLDTETTGLEPSQGHKVIEIGCVELVNRKLTKNNFHTYINPQRDIDDGAIEVHGISNDFLEDKPLFKDIVDDFITYVDGAELIIHNAPFDIGFLDHEFRQLDKKVGSMADYCGVIDSLVLARTKHPGQKNNLDALCKRYEIDNSHRELHGALLDAEILAEVFLLMTGGQKKLAWDDSEGSEYEDHQEKITKIIGRQARPILMANENELSAHQGILEIIDGKSEGAEWRKTATSPES